jgi:hypothetical protein
MNLYEITSEMQGILDAMLDGGVDSPEAMSALDEHLIGLDQALDQKAERYAGLIRELESRAASRSDEARRIRSLAAADEALASRLKERLKGAMETVGRTRLDLPSFRVTVATNGGKQPLEVDPGCIGQWDAPFVTTVVEPNKEAIRIALENGAEIPGCRLLPRGTSLRIK